MNIILLHRDLRMHDNPALFHGTNAEEALVVYVYDKKYWQGNGKSTFQLKFGMDCLKEVSNNLKNRNIPMHVFEGNYEEYESDKKRRLGADANQPQRIRYKPLQR